MNTQAFLARFAMPQDPADLADCDTIAICENPSLAVAEIFRFSITDYPDHFTRVTTSHWINGSKITVMDKETYLRYLSAFGRRSTDHGNSPQSLPINSWGHSAVKE